MEWYEVECNVMENTKKWNEKINYVVIMSGTEETAAHLIAKK